MLKVLEINSIINSVCSYDTINRLGGKKLRNIKGGISINDAMLYKFKYAKIGITKDSIASDINVNNRCNGFRSKSFERKSYNTKESNIPTQAYLLILHKCIELYNKCNINKDEIIFMAVDGSSSNNNKQNVMLNMGYYNIKDKIPINLTCDGTQNRNNEVQMLIKSIKEKPKDYTNVVLIGDRAYFTYELLYFLVQNNIKFIIRSKGSSNNLKSIQDIPKHVSHYSLINYLREYGNLRIIDYNNTYEKIVFDKQNKKKVGQKYNLSIENNCTLITNLDDEDKYSDDEILTLYRERWEIEVYFKFIKSNFKFQNMKENKKESYDRLYICELILTYILKIIELEYIAKHKQKCHTEKNKKGKTINYTVKINHSLLMTGIFDNLLNDILYAKLTENKLNIFCESYVKFIYNETNRHSPRISKKPFSKWYLKGYSSSSAVIKVINAIIENKTDELNKNLKSYAKHIKIIEVDTKIIYDASKNLINPETG